MLVEGTAHAWRTMSLEEAIFFYKEVESIEDQAERRAARAYLGRHDLFYLGAYLCKRTDMVHPWVYARCREVEADPDGYLDLWAREHYKSTIITFLLTIQDILRDPEVTFGIFSHTQDVAVDRLRQIKTELESNVELHYLYEDVLYSNPSVQSPQWSEDGIVVKRQGNPQEATVEAWGLVGGMPTGRHFSHRIYDDVVTEKTVTNTDMIKKATNAYRLSDNLGKKGGKERAVGTIYHPLDTYGVIEREKLLKIRKHPCTSDGSEDFTKAVLLTAKELADKRKKQGAYIFSCQMRLNPNADAAVGFKEEHLRWWEPLHFKNLNVAIIVDPSSGKKRKGNDYTAMWVIGRGGDDNWYVIDLVRDRLNLPQRAKMLLHLHRTYRPKPGCVFYEETGMNADIEAIKFIQEKVENYRFDITALSPGGIPKATRIERLLPLFEAGRIYLPTSIVRTDWEGKAVNLIEVFKTEEYLAYPILSHDDALDALSNIEHEEVKKRVPLPPPPAEPGSYALQQLQRAAKKDRHRIVV